MASYILDYDIKKKIGIISSTSLDVIREHFSIEDSSAKFIRSFRGRFIPTRKFAITPTGRFELGLTLDICKKINQIDGNNTIQLTETIKKHILPGIKISSDQIVNTSDLQLRPYQSEVIETCVKRGRGIAMIATAGGKTLIMNTLISTLMNLNLGKKVLVITPTQLAKQTHDEFLSYKPTYKPTWWTGENEPDKQADVIVAGNKILLSEQQDVSWLLDVDILIVDEVHSLRYGNKINKIIRKFNTCKRFGFTGTLPENLLDQWTIKGLIGPVIYEKTSYELREQQYITSASVQVVKLNYKNVPDYSLSSGPTSQYKQEIDFIIHNSFRNKTIKLIADKCTNNTLILVDRIEHGHEILHAVSENTDKKIYFIRGEVETQERENVKHLMEQSNNIICIAITSIFSTGINIKNLHYIIFAAGGKAKIKIIQSIGRGLRLHESKKQLVIFDIFDDLKYGKKHYVKRIQLYEKEKISYRVKEISEN